jgi:sugar lactone lactonase YvrE
VGPEGAVAWLDIHGNKIFTMRGGVERCFQLESQATVIFRVRDHSLEFGSEVGITALDLNTGAQKLLIGSPVQVRKNLRSNDGCYMRNGRYLMGFMHPTDPSNFPGQLFYYCGEAWHSVDDNIAIPNTFLEISETEFLISDSLLGVVWKYQISLHGRLTDKDLWMQFEGCAPDGGCIYGGYAWIALWDGSCVSRIDLNSKERTDYRMPVPRPTNCAVDEASGRLWVTSAREGLNSEALREAPLSGKTLCFEGVL